MSIINTLDEYKQAVETILTSEAQKQKLEKIHDKMIDEAINNASDARSHITSSVAATLLSFYIELQDQTKTRHIQEIVYETIKDIIETCLEPIT